MIRHLNLDEIDWLGFKEGMPIESNEDDEAKRTKLWPQFDPNGNGLVSLAEADLAFRRMAGPYLPLYYSKKVQILAFNQAKSSVPNESGLQDDFIERSEFLTFLKYCVLYFGYYFMFKILDQDNDDRLRVNDFIGSLLQMRLWGANIKDSKDAKRWFYKYDENRGGVILMDEWVLFAAEQNLQIEKVKIIEEISAKPRIVYSLQSYMKKGAKRPNMINSELWKSKSPRKTSPKLEQEVTQILTKNSQYLQKHDERRKSIQERKKNQNGREYMKINYIVHKNRKPEPQEEMTYEDVENKIQNLDEENYLLKEELQELKSELLKQKKLSQLKEVKI